jgi:predicted glycosyltransferase
MRIPLPDAATPRVVHYCHDGLGLGHFRRTIMVADALGRAHADVSQVLLTAMPNASSFLMPDSLDFVRLPGLDKRELFQGDEDLESDAPSDVFAVRRAIIDAVVESFRPHLMVVDTMPVGLAGELLPILKRFREAKKRPRIVLGLRDVTYGPEQTRQEWTENGAHDLLEHLYDRILIYGSPCVFDPIAAYGFSPDVAAKTTYTGYFRRPEPLLPVEAVRREFAAADRPLIVVSPGGGKDGAPLILAFLEGMRAGLMNDVAASVVTGPQMADEDAARLRELACSVPGVTFSRFRTDVESQMWAADAVVIMGGYNSVWEAVGAGKRPIVVPRRAGSDEQRIRAERLAELGLATVVPPEELTPERLARAVSAELERGTSPAGVVEFDGAERAGRALAEMLDRA